MRLIIFLAIICFSCQNNSNQASEIEALKSQIDILKMEVNALEKDETAFIHTVYFWFKDGISDGEKKKFGDEGLADLITCKSIYKGYYGLPDKAIRDVVDDSYGYALNCLFKSAEDQEIYQNDPQHLAFIDKYKHLWDKVIVYDNLVSK